MNQNLEFISAFDVILKAWNNDSVSTEILFKAKNNVLNSIQAYPANSPISFGDTEHSSLSVNDLMEVLADNNQYMNYCDAIVLDQSNGGKLLINQRTNSDDFQAGKWCLPGGKAEQGEFLRDAVKRELFEETGLIATSCNYSTLYRNPDGSFSHYFYCYVEDCSQLMVDADEVQQYAWIDLKDLDQYDFMFDLVDRIKAIFNVPFKGKYLTEQELAALAVNRIEEPKKSKYNTILGEYGDQVIDHLKDILDMEKAHTATSLETSYSKGCLMLDLNFISREGHNKWDDILMMIESDDVYNEAGFGKEYSPHITVLYGFKLPDVSPWHIEKLLPEGAVSLKIVDVSFFEAENYDVLKFGIESDQLHELNALYKSLPHENKFPDYKPHCTIAYLKKGRAERYIETFKGWVNYQFQSSKFDYSHNDEDGLKTKSHWDVKGFSSIEDSQEDKILKAQYQVGQISQKTGLKKVSAGVWVDPNTGKQVKVDEQGNPQTAKKPVDVNKYTFEELSEYAKNSSQADLEAIVKESREPKLRQAAHKELDRRSKKEEVQEKKEPTKKPEPKKDPKDEQPKELSKEEKEAVTEYTGRGYNNVNWYLRNNEKPDEEAQKLMDNLTAALKKLPDHKGVVYRGISPTKELTEHLADFENNIGGVVEFPAYSSTSEDKARGVKFGGELLFEIKSKSGKSIKEFSSMPHENEVLFDKGSKFKIKKVKKNMAGSRLLSMNVILEQV